MRPCAQRGLVVRFHFGDETLDVRFLRRRPQLHQDALPHDVADDVGRNALIDAMKDVDHDATQTEAFHCVEQNRKPFAQLGALRDVVFVGASRGPPPSIWPTRREGQRAWAAASSA